MSRRLRRVGLGIFSGVLIACAGGLGMLRALWYTPPPVTSVKVEGNTDAPALKPGDTLRVLVWNVQFCGTRRHHFFYDGGDAVHVTREDVDTVLAELTSILREHEPDLVLIQEIDRGADRTAHVDQVAELLAAAPYAAWLTAPYWRVPHVPTPAHQHVGKTDMHLATLSRHRVDGATRHQLSLLDEPFFRRAFNLRRAILEARLAGADGAAGLAVLNTHLSAFSRGDGTLGRQMDQLEARMDALDQDGVPWILGGDFNALPPGDDPARLGEDGELYADQTTPIQRLFDAGRRSAFPLERLQQDPETTWTYLPYGAETPDRTLDYLFVSEGIQVLHAQVLADGESVSDHLPLMVDIRLP